MFTLYAHILEVDFLVIGDRPATGVLSTEGGALDRQGRDPDAETDQAFILCRSSGRLGRQTELALSLEQVASPKRSSSRASRASYSGLVSGRVSGF